MRAAPAACELRKERRYSLYRLLGLYGSELAYRYTALVQVSATRGPTVSDSVATWLAFGPVKVAGPAKSLFRILSAILGLRLSVRSVSGAWNLAQVLTAATFLACASLIYGACSYTCTSAESCWSSHRSVCMYYAWTAMGIVLTGAGGQHEEDSDGELAEHGCEASVVAYSLCIIPYVIVSGIELHACPAIKTPQETTR